MSTSATLAGPAETASAPGSASPPATDWVAVARALGPGFAARAPAHDANDSFPAENVRELKSHRVYSAAVPTELGGGGASHRELCAMLRELGRHCGSTALALSMHTHLVATTVWLWRQGAPVAALLQGIAAQQLVLVSTGASDWLDSSGTAEPVVGGYRVSGRKPFASGSPVGDLLLTSAVDEGAPGGPQVLHFSVPFTAGGVTVLDTWRTMGMRASGSNDVLLDGVFVPDGAVSSRGPQGAWDPLLNAISAIAVPLVASVYLGVAGAARDLALQRAARKRDDPGTWYLAGELENALVGAELAVQGMIDLCDGYAFAPVPATASAMFVRKSIAAGALLLVAGKAMELAGGGAYFRSVGLERLVRDLHAVQFHPLQAKPQMRFTGRLALGLDPVE